MPLQCGWYTLSVLLIYRELVWKNVLESVRYALEIVYWTGARFRLICFNLIVKSYLFT